MAKSKQPESAAQPRVSARKQREAEMEQATRQRRLRMGGLVMLVIVGVVALGVWRNSSQPGTLADSERPRNIDGPADALVQIVEFGDLGCPACRSWHNAGIKDQLQETYGDQVSFEFRHFAVITAQSPKAAEAAQCAGDQGAFWAYHDYVYEQTPIGALAVDNLKAYADAVGLDRAAFDACLDGAVYAPLVSAERQAAARAGARGTPTFFINNEQVAPTYASLSQAIETIIAEQ